MLIGCRLTKNSSCHAVDLILPKRSDSRRAGLVTQQSVDLSRMKRSCQRQTQVLDLPASDA